MKTYVLMVSRYFPKGHSKEGQLTNFAYKICIRNIVRVHSRLGGEDKPEDKKIHTIRANYDLWAKRFEEINAGKACLSLRYWEGKPRRSKQIPFATLTKDDGIGLQKLGITTDFRTAIHYEKGHHKFYNAETIANNDGLTLADWKEWFKGYDLSKPMAIIHFTNFRY